MLYKLQAEEIIPHVTPLAGMSVLDYLDVINQRFAYPAIIDTVLRVVFDGVARYVGFILPLIRDCLKAGISVDGLALVEAAWARMCLGIRKDGSEIVANDTSWNMLKKQS